MIKIYFLITTFIYLGCGSSEDFNLETAEITSEPLDHSVYLLDSGDSDQDGIPNSIDNCPILANGPQNDRDFDLSGDGCDADFTNDGLVGVGDYVLLLNNFGKSGLPPYTNGDCNGDGAVGAGDYACLSNYFGLRTQKRETYVRFDRSNCDTTHGQIEVQLNGLPHPQFPVVQPGDCFLVEISVAKTSLRTRCAPRAGQTAYLASDWTATPKIPTDTRGTSSCARILN